MHIFRKASLVTISVSTTAGFGLLWNKFVALSEAQPTLTPSSVCSYTYNANNPTEDRHINAEFVDDWQCSAIFDGHGGWQVAEFASKLIFNQLRKNLKENKSISEVLVKTYSDVEESYINSVRETYKLGYGDVAKVGACTLLAIKKGNQLVTANCGDCRAILATNKEGTSSSGIFAWIKLLAPTPSAADDLIAYRLTNDHNAREPVEQDKLRREHPGVC